MEVSKSSYSGRVYNFFAVSRYIHIALYIDVLFKESVSPKMKNFVFGALGRMVKIRDACDKSVWLYK